MNKKNYLYQGQRGGEDDGAAGDAPPASDEAHLLTGSLPSPLDPSPAGARNAENGGRWETKGGHGPAPLGEEIGLVFVANRTTGVL